MIKNYLATLHTKPDHHKKRFSLLVAGSFTLLIFTVWATVNFGTGSVIAEAPIEERVAQAESPFENFRASAADSWRLVTGQLDKAKEGLESVNLDNSYTEVRNGALNNQYGQ
jgi:hypothetical protein